MPCYLEYGCDLVLPEMSRPRLRVESAAAATQTPLLVALPSRPSSRNLWKWVSVLVEISSLACIDPHSTCDRTADRDCGRSCRVLEEKKLLPGGDAPGEGSGVLVSCNFGKSAHRYTQVTQEHILSSIFLQKGCVVIEVGACHPGNSQPTERGISPHERVTPCGNVIKD